MLTASFFTPASTGLWYPCFPLPTVTVVIVSPHSLSLIYVGVAERPTFSLPSLFSTPFTTPLQSDFGHSALCLASRPTSLPLLKASPLPTGNRCMDTHTDPSCLTCQKPFSSIFPLLIHLDRQGPWAEFSKPTQGTGTRRTKPGRRWSS